MRGENFSAEVPIDTEDPTEKRSKKFVAFLRDGKYTADQIREAYYRLMKVSHATEEDSRVQEILTEMEKMVADRFPVNRFVQLIEMKQELEDSVGIFERYIEGLAISSNEKRMLSSIVKKRRNGELSFHIDGDRIARIKIETGENSDESIASELTRALRKCLEHVPEGIKYKFIFTS